MEGTNQKQQSTAGASAPYFTPLRSPLHDASVLSRLTYSWISGLIFLGASKSLDPEDVYPLPDFFDSQKVYEQAVTAWIQEQKNAKEKGRAPFLGYALFQAFGREVFYGALTILPYLVAAVLQPLFVSHILEFVSIGKTEFLGIQSGIGLVLLLGAVSIVGILSFNQGFYFISKCGIFCRISIISMVFCKSLMLSSASKSKNSTGEILTLMSGDTERVWQSLLFSNWLWAGPVLCLVALALLILTVGLSALAGFGTLLLVYFVQTKCGDLAGASRRECVKCTEERVKVTNEMLQGIRVVKLYAWEDSIEKRLELVRTRELLALRRFHLLRTMNAALMYLGPLLVAFALFLCFVLTGGTLNVPIVYSTYALLNLLRLPFSITPQAYAAMAEARVSLQRLTKFLELENLDNLEWNISKENNNDVSLIANPSTNSASSSNSNSNDSSNDSEESNLIVNISDADYYWSTKAAVDKGESSPILKNVNLKIKRGEFIAVIGNVGSGKSSLLSAILGEMFKSKGSHVKIKKIAYISQEHWIQNCKLMDNIQFGSKFVDDKYISVLDASQLSQDLLSLPSGDYTSIGERGINLSGGQKARVSIGRALYNSDADLVLVDDALAAVDVHVGKALFHDALETMLKDKARIVVLSSNYHLLQNFDRILVVLDGQIKKSGTYQEIIAEFPQYASMSGMNSSSSSPNLNVVANITKPAGGNTELENDSVFVDSMYKKHESEILAKRSAESSSIITSEDRERGEVSANIYVTYFSAASGAASRGGYVLVFILALFIVSQGGRVLGDIWMGLWAATNPQSINYQYLTWYCVITGITCCLVIYRSFYFIVASLNAAKNIHATVVRSVLNAPINNYFDITPIGRILNRFSKDVDSMDSLLPEFFLQNLQNVSQVVAIALMCVISSPYFILIMIPFVILFYYIQNFFSKTSRELKRIEGVSRSPVYSIFEEVLQGLFTIRAYDKSKNFNETFFRLVNNNSQHFFAFWIVNRWLAIRLDFVGVCMIFLVAVLAVGVSTSGVKVDPNLLGMALVYALQLTGLLQWSVRVTIETETNMTSIERLMAFTKIPHEAVNPIYNPATAGEDATEVVAEVTASDLSVNTERRIELANRKRLNSSDLNGKTWPSHGKVSFKNLKLRYRKNLDLVLKGVSCEIPGGCKCGIVGRTASGKSSLTLALFRIVEPEEGDIQIDDVSILGVNLTQLRTNITIIPQDPVMFSGTIRYNLDPFGLYSEEEVWESLERAQLKNDIIEKFPLQLDHVLTERGENVSVGQKQLICIARALLRNSKIIIMDEATASVDSETDAKIQDTIRKEFKNRTVLTIAHRLETIADYDMIIVMSQGEVAEFDSPAKLLDINNTQYTMFKALVDELGTDRKENFISLANRK